MADPRHVMEGLRCPDCDSPLVAASQTLEFCGKCLAGILEDEGVGDLGRYEIERRLGEGSAGQVYLAVDPDLGRRVAIKVLAEHVASQEELLQRFRREARTLAALSHENIVPIYAFEQTQDHSLLVMEYLAGHSLAERIGRGGVLSIDEILNYTLQIARGLAAAHEQQVVHRDLKPANLLIDGARLKIADFGLAKNEVRLTANTSGKSDPLTQTGLVVGTVPYMSPEQARGRAVDVRTDLFSLGVVVYELVTGHRPFRGATTFTLMTSILTDCPPALRSIRSDVPRELELIVATCLEKNRSKRRITAAQIAERVERLQRRGHQATSLGSIAQKLRGLIQRRTRPDAKEPRSECPILGVLPPRHEHHPDLEFIAFGIADGLGLRLSTSSELDVRSGNSVVAIQGQPAQAIEGARLMNLHWLLTGRLSGSIDDLDLHLELIHTATREAKWHTRLKCSATQLRPRLENLAAEIEATILGREQAAMTSMRQRSPEAELLVLKGLHAFRQLTPCSLKQAAVLFSEACELDETSARAHGWLALSRLQLAKANERTDIRSHALRAVELEPTSGELQCILGNVLWLMEWDFATAEAAFERALDLAPTFPLTPHSYSLFLSCLGRHREALAQAKRAVELDPLNPITSLDLGRRLLLAGRAHEAEAPIRETLELHPDYDLAYSYLGQVRLRQGRCEEAVRLLEKGSRHGLWQGGFLGAANAACGHVAEAEEILRRLASQAQPRDTQCAMVLTALGDRESAFEALETALQRRDEQLLWLGVEPAFSSLRGGRRFRRLAKAIGLPKNLWGSMSSAHHLQARDPVTDDLPLQP